MEDKQEEGEEGGGGGRRRGAGESETERGGEVLDVQRGGEGDRTGFEVRKRRFWRKTVRDKRE